ncbi:hypothetical protein CISG_10318 [Coccidioides immitis RMSCC 3703]|uniref:Uncharacterized protein n=2 Tax=Coccidioides immitis TaxID=5501 RepID=A0A0J8QQ27_COCIT|nr:hypothetical protein CIRG_06368 [Coccidioides immitis RMSCC 2394]KMU74624.1 hypothetical protein CISG_10318 [Coccidioides immitis RMSCC 3703]
MSDENFERIFQQEKNDLLLTEDNGPISILLILSTEDNEHTSISFKLLTGDNRPLTEDNRCKSTAFLLTGDNGPTFFVLLTEDNWPTFILLIPSAVKEVLLDFHESSKTHN